MSAPTPVPTVGLPLPRATDAHMTPDKLKWILADHGHGREWGRVFRIREEDSERLWTAIAQAEITSFPLDSAERVIFVPLAQLHRIG